MKISVLADVAPCSLVETDGGFRDATTIRPRSGRMTGTVSTSETSISFYLATRRDILEDIHLQIDTYVYYECTRTYMHKCMNTQVLHKPKQIQTVQTDRYTDSCVPEQTYKHKNEGM
jgi:hypothetical protein